MSWCGFSSCLSINFTDLDKIRRALRGRKTGRSWKEILYCLWEPHWARVWDLWPKPSGIRLRDDDQRLKSVQDLHRFTEGVHFDVKKTGKSAESSDKNIIFLQLLRPYCLTFTVSLYSPSKTLGKESGKNDSDMKCVEDFWQLNHLNFTWSSIFTAASPRHWHVCSCFSLVWTGF